MKLLKPAIAAVLLCLVGAGSAQADHRHHRHGPRIHFGIHMGPMWGSWYGPRYYAPPPVYYAPPVVIERAPPPVYIERPAAVVEPPSSSYWYYCPSANGYYPYVNQCPEGWQAVPPRPAG